MHVPQSVWWGLVPGLVTAAVGSYKDTLYEDFELRKFFRSPVLTLLWYVVVDWFFPLAPVFLKVGTCSMLERITVETYKAVIRHPPGKFKNCSCDNGTCTVHKDRGWMLDRVSRADPNYSGRIE